MAIVGVARYSTFLDVIRLSAKAQPGSPRGASAIIHSLYLGLDTFAGGLIDGFGLVEILACPRSRTFSSICWL